MLGEWFVGEWFVRGMVMVMVRDIIWIMVMVRSTVRVGNMILVFVRVMEKVKDVVKIRLGIVLRLG